MGTLDARDYARILDLAVELLDGRGPEPEWAHVGNYLNDCLHGRLCLFLDDVRWEVRAGRVKAWSGEDLAALPMDQLLRQNMTQHPVAQYYALHDDRRPLAVNDVSSEATWHRTGTYSTMRELFGVDQQIALPLDAPAGVIRSFLICRPPGEEVSERDKSFALRVQPIIVRVDAHMRELDRLRRLITPVNDPKDAASFGITPRELIVLSLLAAGLTAVAISHRLHISVHTVSKHQQNLYRKLDTSDRLTTVLRAQQLGILGTSTALSRPK